MRKRKFRVPPILFLSWGVFFVVLFARMISERPDGFWVGHENVWSDWALHLGLATTFAEKSPSLWFEYHPMYADGKMTYTFLTNLVSGLLMRAGLSIPLSFILPSIALSLLLLAGMYKLLLVLLRSPKKALLAISLFFLGAGVRGALWFSDFYNNPKLISLFIPPKQYGRLDSHQWYSGNFIVGILLPQRSALIGMTIAVWSLFGLFYALTRRSLDERSRRRIFWASGLLGGLLPIAHMHSLIALLGLIGILLLYRWREWRRWIHYIAPLGALSASLFLIFIAGGLRTGSFMTWHPGYTAQGFADWIWFWFQCWGLIIPVALVGLWKSRRDFPLAALFVLGALGLFVIGNLILFQPIAWDNSKIFMWTYFALCGAAAHWLVPLWRGNGLKRSAAAALTLVLTFTGALELLLLQRIDSHTHLLIGREELELADRIRIVTDPLARFLTSKDHNHLVMVRGSRPILLGFTPWVLNYGFDYHSTEKDIGTMYRGGEEAKALLAKHRISYVVIGPAERHNFKPDIDFFTRSFPTELSTARYKVYDTRSLLK